MLPYAFGDGAANEGTFHEGLNFASILNLPVIFVCENNQFAEGTTHDYASASERLLNVLLHIICQAYVWMA